MFCPSFPISLALASSCRESPAMSQSSVEEVCPCHCSTTSHHTLQMLESREGQQLPSRVRVPHKDAPRPYRVYLKRCLSFFLIRASSLNTVQIWIYKGRVSKIHPNGRQYLMLKNRSKCHINTQDSDNRSIFVQDGCILNQMKVDIKIEVSAESQ